MAHGSRDFAATRDDIDPGILVVGISRKPVGGFISVALNPHVLVGNGQRDGWIDLCAVVRAGICPSW